MGSVKSEVKKTLKINRNFMYSRLESKHLASAYEIVISLKKRIISNNQDLKHSNVQSIKASQKKYIA